MTSELPEPIERLLVQLDVLVAANPKDAVQIADRFAAETWAQAWEIWRGLTPSP